MLLTTVRKGAGLGIVAGLVITLFDAFFLLLENTYIPADFPVFLAGFNIGFWAIIGILCALALWCWTRGRAYPSNKENCYWAAFFLFPFVLIAGTLGRITPGGVGRISPNVDEFLPQPFDYHLSFLWALFIVLFLIIFEQAATSKKRPAVFYMVVTALIVAVFQFCSNIHKIDFFTQGYFFLTASLKTIPGFRLTLGRYRIILYVVGVMSIQCFCLIAFFKLKASRVKQRHMLTALIVAVVGLLACFYFWGQAGYGRRFSTPVADHSEVVRRSPPLVILIVLDTVRADLLSMYGSCKTTKNLEEFSRDALVFNNCIASSSWTLPSHASLFTGLSLTEHGSHHVLSAGKVWHGFSPPRPLNDTFVTLAEIFQNSGYRTAGIIGNHTIINKAFNFDQGFDLFDSAGSIGSVCLFPFRPIFPLFCFVTNTKPGFHLFYRVAEHINTSVIRLLGKNDPDPLFLFVNYMDAHDMYSPPRPFSTVFSESSFPQLARLKQVGLKFFKSEAVEERDALLLAQYKGEIAYLDQQLGELFSILREKNLYDSALIIVTSDHGELFGEHDLYNHHTPIYEPAGKVPLLIKFPFARKRGRDKTPITTADLFSTILALCELPIPGYVSGRPFGSTETPSVSELYSDTLGVHRTLFDGNYKYMAYEKDKKPELYDLEKDPMEQVNQAWALPETSEAMAEKLRLWEETHRPKYSEKKSNKKWKETSISSKTLEKLKALGYVQ